MSKIGFSLGHIKKKIKLVPTTSNTDAKEEKNTSTFGIFSASNNKDENIKKHFVTGFNSSGKLEKVNGEDENTELVIPLIAQNEWREAKEIKEIKVPNIKKNLVTSEEVDEDEVAAQALLKDIREGEVNEVKNEELVIPIPEMEKKKKELFNHQNKDGKSNQKAPILFQNKIPGMENLSSENEKFHQDLSMRPDALDVSSSTYQVIPIEEFGAAMLRGMGWKGIVKKGLDEESLQPRHRRLGLGATPKPPSPKKKHNKSSKKKNGEKERTRDDKRDERYKDPLKDDKKDECYKDSLKDDRKDDRFRNERRDDRNKDQSKDRRRDKKDSRYDKKDSRHERKEDSRRYEKERRRYEDEDDQSQNRYIKNRRNEKDRDRKRH